VQLSWSSSTLAKAVIPQAQLYLPPQLAMSNLTVVAGYNATVTALATINLTSANSSQSVVVSYATADNGSATAGSDYTATSGSLSFAPGVSSQVIAIPILGDTSIELTETFLVNLSNPVGATLINNQATVTILPAPTISISDAGVTEGDTAVGPSATFVISLSAPSTQQITIHYATAFGTAGTTDLFNSSGNVTFNPGVTAVNLGVLTKGDTLDEDDETFFVNLSASVNASIADAQGVGTLLDNDPLPNMSISDVSIAEGDSGSVNAESFLYNPDMPAKAKTTPSASHFTSSPAGLLRISGKLVH
jgi:hypothetical protein